MSRSYSLQGNSNKLYWEKTQLLSLTGFGFILTYSYLLMKKSLPWTFWRTCQQIGGVGLRGYNLVPRGAKEVFGLILAKLDSKILVKQACRLWG